MTNEITSLILMNDELKKKPIKVTKLYFFFFLELCSTIIGPAFSPLIGGYVAQYLGWRWIFYICTILGGVIFIADVVLLRETLYRPNYEKPKSRIEYLKFNPVSPMILFE